MIEVLQRDKNKCAFDIASILFSIFYFTLAFIVILCFNADALLLDTHCMTVEPSPFFIEMLCGFPLSNQTATHHLESKKE